MKTLIIICLFLWTTVLAGNCLATDLSSTQSIGLRMGFWSAVQAKHIPVTPDQEILSKVTAPYGELVIFTGLKKGFGLEFSLGSYYRGETRYTVTQGYFFKRVTIYPVSVQLKFYPLYAVKKSRWQPYLDSGIGFISGIEDLRLGEYAGSQLFVETGTSTHATLGWQAGGGLDFELSRRLVIAADCKYRGVKFNQDVGGLRDYSGPEVTLGVIYILKKI
ncbi:MAG: hypothetical protein WCE90_10830 [Candidatus Zixiibacteriota bacterium]